MSKTTTCCVDDEWKCIMECAIVEMHNGNALAKFEQPLNKLMGGIVNGIVTMWVVW